jgi:hypothetical protein
MTATSTARDEALKTAEEAYQSIREYVEGIAESDMLHPHRIGVWSGKDLVIHVADWESEGARIFNELAAGQPERWMPEDVDGNAFNEQRVAAHAAKSLQEALEYWQASHQKLLDAWRATSVEREDILISLTLDHYRMHYPDFRHVKPFQPLGDDAREILVAEMDASHDAFLALVSSIPEAKLLEQNTVGVWSGKDLIAHLGHWQDAAIALTRELENDRPGKWPGEDDSNINQWNESKVNAMRDLDLAEVRAYQQSAYEQLRELLRGSPYATRSAGIGATQFHYGLHREDFESLA